MPTLAYICDVTLNHLEDLFMKFSFLFQESPSISTVCVCLGERVWKAEFEKARVSSMAAFRHR